VVFVSGVRCRLSVGLAAAVVALGCEVVLAGTVTVAAAPVGLPPLVVSPATELSVPAATTGSKALPVGASPEGGV